MSNIESRPCKRCLGVGALRRGYGDDPDAMQECYGCHGAKVFAAPDMAKILERISTTRGGNGKRKIRASWKREDNRYENRDEGRAYYVWRIARFNGGKDVCLPMTADMLVRSDPFKPELEKMADEVAKAAFGTDMAAALRWGRALGYDIPTIPGEPATAQTGGPVRED